MPDKPCAPKTQPIQAAPANTGSSGRPNGLFIAFVLAYAAVVLAVDTLAAHQLKIGLDWGMFRWSLHDFARLLGSKSANSGFFREFDLFKFTFWFLVPFVVSLWRMDWGWLGFQRWKRLDVVLLAVFLLLAAAAMFVIPLFPSLRSTYPSLKNLASHHKAAVLLNKTVWTFSWLVGWEFLHRYFLLRNVHARWPRFGWMLTPFFEVAYHLQKPQLEAAAMGLFSIIACRWTLRRRNMAVPFLVHLGIELSLWLFMLFT